jgi:hypothetical protein
VGRLDEDDAGPACRLGAEILDVPVIAEPVFGAVLAHGRDDDPVARRHTAKRDRPEQMGALAHRVLFSFPRDVQSSKKANDRRPRKSRKRKESLRI